MKSSFGKAFYLAGGILRRFNLGGVEVVVAEFLVDQIDIPLFLLTLLLCF